MRDIDLTGKTAIVTGASKGIGKATAILLAELGANIVLNYRKTPVSDLIEEIKSKGVKVMAVKADISKFDEAEILIKEALNEFKSIDILVNNAGITMDNLVVRMNEDEFDKVIATNLKGSFNTIRHVGRIMIRQKKGKIVNVSSVVGISGNIGQINYSSAKAGILGMTKSSAKEFGMSGVNVNAVAPGFIKTDMSEVLPDKQKDLMIKNIPLKREGTPEDVAKVIAFLVSDMADYITGQVIKVDGGMVM